MSAMPSRIASSAPCRFDERATNFCLKRRNYPDGETTKRDCGGAAVLGCGRFLGSVWLSRLLSSLCVQPVASGGYVMAIVYCEALGDSYVVRDQALGDVVIAVSVR